MEQLAGRNQHKPHHNFHMREKNPIKGDEVIKTLYS